MTCPSVWTNEILSNFSMYIHIKIALHVYTLPTAKIHGLCYQTNIVNIS